MSCQAAECSLTDNLDRCINSAAALVRHSLATEMAAEMRGMPRVLVQVSERSNRWVTTCRRVGGMTTEVRESCQVPVTHERSNRWHTDMCLWKHQLKVGLVIMTSLAQVIDWLPAWLPFAVQPPAVDNPCGVVPRHVPFQGG